MPIVNNDFFLGVGALRFFPSKYLAFSTFSIINKYDFYSGEKWTLYF